MKVVFDLILDRKLTLYVSAALKDEVLEKMQYYNVSKQIQDEVMLFMNKLGILIEPKVKVTVCRDPEDNFVLELAETSRADYIITRDKDLLDLPNHEWKGTKIIKPEAYLPLLRTWKIL